MLKEYPSIEPQLIIDLADAYHRNEIEHIDETARLRVLSSRLPDGIQFVLRDTVIELTDPFEEEVQLLVQSLSLQKECGLIATEHRKYFIDGSKYSLSQKIVFTTLLMLGAHRETKGYFTHTHWDSNLHFLPSLGDIRCISYLHDYYPNIEGRIVFPTEKGVKVFKYADIFPINE